MNLDVIAFDADDTLWHNERIFQITQARFAEMLADFTDRESLDQRLQAAERRNLGRYGFGIKGFMLSMIETAVDVTEGRVPGHVIQDIISAGQEMLAHPIELLPGVEEILEALEGRNLLLITKGDLLDQERKLAQSGLGELFTGVEIVSDKTPAVYSAICSSRHVDPRQLLMVGNSMKSDILPILNIGGWGAFVPQSLAWDFEHAETPSEHPRLIEVANMSELKSVLLERMS